MVVNSSVALCGGHGESLGAEEARANLRSPVVTKLLRPPCLVKVMPLIGQTLYLGASYLGHHAIIPRKVYSMKEQLPFDYSTLLTLAADR